MKSVLLKVRALLLVYVVVATGLLSCGSSNRQLGYDNGYQHSSVDSYEPDPLRPQQARGSDLGDVVSGLTSTFNNQSEAQIASAQYVRQSNVAARMQETSVLAKKTLDETTQKPKERILSYSASLGMYANTRNDTILSAITDIAKGNKGHVLYSNAQSVVVAVPSSVLDTTIKRISGLGEVHYKNIRGNDVTDHYLDLQTRISNAEKTLQRFLDLLAKANTVESAVAVEKEIDRVNSQIESYKSQLARMNETITYSTITVTLSEKITPGPVGYVFVGLYKVVKWLFVW